MNKLTTARSQATGLSFHFMFTHHARPNPWFAVALFAGAFLSSAFAEAAAEPPASVNHFKRILIADAEAKAAAFKAPENAGPVVVEGVPILATKEFADFVAPYIGKPITTDSVNHLAADINTYVRKHDRLVVNVLIPNQDIGAGDFRLAVVIGRYNQLQFKGNRWFSSDLLKSKLGVKPGDEVRLSTLEQAVNWANSNPFRHLQVLINTVNMRPGIADLDVSVQERIPVRISASYDDTGTDLIGNNHYTASVQLGNLWGLDHQASYQFTTTDISHLYQAQSGDYKVPLPWHHYVQFAAAYARVRPDIPGLTLTGKDVIADLRYIAPFSKGSWSFEPSAGFDFKQINNNLLVGGYQVLGSSVNIAQVTAALTAIRKDTHGNWVFAANGNFSPGGFNNRNTQAAFNNSPRAGANPRYIYGTFMAQRATALPSGFQLVSRGQLQLSSANLESSEELSIGGVATVRGYNEHILSGDYGWVLNQELQGPVWDKHLPFLPKTYKPLQTRALLFWDYGHVFYRNRFRSDIPLDALMSTGIGLRSSLASNVSLSADWGWQLLHTTFPQPQRSRGHIRVTMAY